MRFLCKQAFAWLFAVALFWGLSGSGSAAPLAQKQATAKYDTSLYRAMKWRNIGPFRGGRVTAVAGVPSQPLVHYMGATGGGVWKTEDGGLTWKNISDGWFKTGSVGAIAVAESDPNVIYVGMGERSVRGNFSHGDGVYKSVDGGKTWKHIGLSDIRQTGKIIVHPRNPDLVYVAALGHVFGPSEQRGVFRSKDGGRHWEKVLFVDNKTGAVDLAMDPNNPRVLYAGFWQVSRTPWGLYSGGPGSGLYKTTDGGDTWKKLTKGLPEGVKGKIGVTVSPAKRDRVWAIIEAKDGGVFRSDDGGESWRRVNSERKLRQRAWYYTHIYADPLEPETVYVLNVQFHKSVDGGRTYKTIRTPHGDNHDLWIDPHNNKRMIEGNDGGAIVTYNGGETWTNEDNQPTAQFYHVITDNQFPYRVYGAQQDNSTVSIASRTTGFGIGRTDWYSVGGGESGYIAPNPADPNIVYAGSYDGLLTRYDHRTKELRNITVWPDNPMGWGAAKLKYRFQWTFPIIISPHDPNVLYVAGNVVFKSTNEGQSWKAISQDLTTNDKSKQGPSGGPITHDNTSVEYYCTVFSLVESPHEKGVLWAGSDDGLVHITRDGGQHWTNVTPKSMPKWALINNIEVSPHDPATAFLAVTRYKLDDFKPYIYKTTDYGKTWK
ncbi:MAG: glycosyl hydrolase, partial [Calditrichaeota bacterium]